MKESIAYWASVISIIGFLLAMSGWLIESVAKDRTILVAFLSPVTVAMLLVFGLGLAIHFGWLDR